MKVEKNKIVFSIILVTILLFLLSYAAITFGGDEENETNVNQIPVPELEDGEEQYRTKLEALDAIKEERERTAPSLYPEHMVDEKGYFNPDYMEYEKQRIIDSIYALGEERYASQRYDNIGDNENFRNTSSEIERDTLKEIDDEDEIEIKETQVAAKERALEHQLFFASYPIENVSHQKGSTDSFIRVKVDGTQTIRKDYRLRMRLVDGATIYGKRFPKNTVLYGFVNFKPNRAMVSISNIEHTPLKLTAHDLQDGEEGIYVVNTFKSEVTQEIVTDMVDNINIPGMPDIAGTVNTGANGIKRIFKRDRQNTKVTILDNYQMILKLPKPSMQEVFGKPITGL